MAKQCPAQPELSCAPGDRALGRHKAAESLREERGSALATSDPGDGRSLEHAAGMDSHQSRIVQHREEGEPYPSVMQFHLEVGNIYG